MLSLLAFGLGVAALPVPPVMALAGLVTAVSALLLACGRTGEKPLPSPRGVWGTAAVLLGLSGGALVFQDLPPLGLWWSLGFGFCLATPVFLRWFGEGFRQP